MRASLDLLDRPQSQHLKGAVVQFPAVVLAHARILSDPTPEVDLLTNCLVRASHIVQMLPRCAFCAPVAAIVALAGGRRGAGV
jgi:hypothetical protein